MCLEQVPEGLRPILFQVKSESGAHHFLAQLLMEICFILLKGKHRLVIEFGNSELILNFNFKQSICIFLNDSLFGYTNNIFTEGFEIF